MHAIDAHTVLLTWPIPVPAKTAPLISCRLVRKKVRGAGKLREEGSDSDDDVLHAALAGGDGDVHGDIEANAMKAEEEPEKLDLNAADIKVLTDADGGTWKYMSGWERKQLEYKVAAQWRQRQRAQAAGRVRYDLEKWGSEVELPKQFGCAIGVPKESISIGEVLRQMKRVAYDAQLTPQDVWIRREDAPTAFRQQVTAFMSADVSGDGGSQEWTEKDPDVISVSRWRTVVVGESAWVEVELSGFNPGTSHRFRVQYANSVGWGLPSDASIRVKVPALRPDAPSKPELFCPIEVIPKRKRKKGEYIKPSDLPPENEPPKYRRRPGIIELYMTWLAPHPNGSAVHTYVVEARRCVEGADWFELVTLSTLKCMDTFGTDFQEAMQSRLIGDWEVYGAAAEVSQPAEATGDDGPPPSPKRHVSKFAPPVVLHKSMADIVRELHERASKPPGHTPEGGYELGACLRLRDDVAAACLAAPPDAPISERSVQFRVSAVNSEGRGEPGPESAAYVLL